MADIKPELSELSHNPSQEKGRKPYANYVSARPTVLPDGTYTHRTPRTFEDYCEAFGYGEHGEGLKGKKILDVGTGDSDFAHEARERNLTDVISVDADYGKTPPIDKRETIIGLGKNLPFQDGTFDEAVSSYMFQWLRQDDIAKILSEMIRVTKNNGSIKIYPARIINPNIVLPEQIMLAQHVKNGFQTLEIKKKSQLSPDTWNDIFNEITQHVGFYMG